MMDLFLKLLNMGMAASWIVLAVLICRIALRKAPKWVMCLLWAAVGLRLVIPFSVESVFSMVPSAEVVPQNILVSQTPAIDSGIPGITGAVNPLFTRYVTLGGVSLAGILSVLRWVWIAGMAAMLVFGAGAYFRLRWQVRVSLRYRDNVYSCDEVPSPFILGVFHPRIYIPSGIDEGQLSYILAHENAHIARGDHWWKPLGFLLLTVYWFNPLLWLAYILLCKDIESACDEKVIAGMDRSEKKHYSEALLACSMPHRMIMVCPLAFGGTGVKSRIKGVLNYKKPAFWILAASAVACGIVVVCFLTNPKPCKHIYHSQITVSPTCTEKGIETFTCELCQHSYTAPAERTAHTYDNGIVDVAPTCTHPGCLIVSCTACGAKSTKELQKTDHIFAGSFIRTAPDCSHEGELCATCTECHETFVVEVLQTNDEHNMQETVLRTPTCGDHGEGVITCSRCGYSESCSYDLLEHTYVTVERIEPVCTFTEGHQHDRCTLCGHERWLVIPGPGDHFWSYDGWGGYFCWFCGARK